MLRVIFTIATPTVVNMIIDSLYNLGDTYFVSGIGDAAIAAVGANDSLMNIIRAISIGFAMGSSSFVSRALGARKDEQASKVAVTTLFTSMTVLTIFAILGLIFIDPLVRLLGATPEMYDYSVVYARWVLLSAPFTAANVCLAQTLRSEGRTGYSMIASVTGNILDLFMNYYFIIVFGWGVAGAAISTDIAKLITFSILLYPFIKKRTIIQLKSSNFSPTKETYGEIARMGIPTMLRSSMMSVSAIVINNIAVSFGNAAVAAVVIANKSLRLVGSAVMGFGQGFQPIAGYSYGAKQFGRVAKAFRYTLIIGAIVGLVLGIGLVFFATPIIQIFSNDPDTLTLGLVLIWTQSVVMIPHVSTMIITGLFQAMGNAMKAAVLGLSRQLFVLIPAVLILSRAFGVNGLTWAQAVADVVSCGLAVVLVVPTLKQLSGLEKGTIVIEGEIVENVIDLDDIDDVG